MAETCSHFLETTADSLIKHQWLVWEGTSIPRNLQSRLLDCLPLSKIVILSDRAHTGPSLSIVSQAQQNRYNLKLRSFESSNYHHTALNCTDLRKISNPPGCKVQMFSKASSWIILSHILGLARTRSNDLCIYHWDWENLLLKDQSRRFTEIGRKGQTCFSKRFLPLFVMKTAGSSGRQVQRWQEGSGKTKSQICQIVIRESSGRLTEINLSAPGVSTLTLPKKIIFVDKFLVKLAGHDTAGVGGWEEQQGNSFCFS